MKKLIAILIMVVVCASLFTGCGSKKSEEQQAREEIQQHLQEEAAADGVDLQAEIEKEASEAYAAMDARAQEREAKQASKEELDSYYNPLLQAEYDALIAATTAEDTMAHGQRYNELIEERNARGEESGISWSGRSSYLLIDASYISKAMFLSAEKYSDYDEYAVYHTGDSTFRAGKPDTLLLMYAKKYNSDSWSHDWSEVVFIQEDFFVCRLTLSDYFDSDCYYEITNISSSYVELCALNLDWSYYLFDITGTEAVLTEKSTDYSDSEAYKSKVAAMIPNEEKMSESNDYVPYWDDTLDELNKMIIENSEFGAASNSYH